MASSSRNPLSPCKPLPPPLHDPFFRTDPPSVITPTLPNPLFWNLLPSYLSNSSSFLNPTSQALPATLHSICNRKRRKRKREITVESRLEMHTEYGRKFWICASWTESYGDAFETKHQTYCRKNEGWGFFSLSISFSRGLGCWFREENRGHNCFSKDEKLHKAQSFFIQHIKAGLVSSINSIIMFVVIYENVRSTVKSEINPIVDLKRVIHSLLNQLSLAFF